MAGIAVRITTNAVEVAREIGAVSARARDLTPAMKRVGEHMLRSVDENFRAEGRPRRWAPLSERYRRSRRKRRGSPKILTLRHRLRRSITYRAGRREVTLGTNVIYARTHQLGNPRRGIPARPFLVVQRDDRAAILEIVGKYVMGGEA